MQASFLSHTDAALRNRNSILHYIKKYGPVSRTDIWESVNISRASVTQVIRQLQEGDLIAETGEGESSGGRKPVFLSFHGAGRKLYAFDWTTKILCLMDLDGKLLDERRIHFPEEMSPVAFATAVEQTMKEIDSKGYYTPEQMIGFGVALPGLIDPIHGTVLYSVELGWQNVSLQALFHERFGQNVYLERTGNAMALGANSLPEVSDAEHLQLIILGDDGIGASAVIHGDCQHGANQMFGELGHIKTTCDVVCSCGQRGCMEAVIHRLLVESAGRMTDEILEYLSIAVSTALNISDASHCILVGSYVDGLCSEEKLILTEKIRQKLTGIYLRQLKISCCHDMKRLSLQGICANVFDRYFSIV